MRQLNDQLEKARAFLDAFDARIAGDLLAEPRTDLPEHALFSHLSRLWNHYLDVEKQELQVEEFSCGVVTIDRHGLVESMNTRATALLGFDNAGEIVGESVDQLVPQGATRDALLATLASACAIPRTIPCELGSPNGPIFLELSIGPHSQPFQCSILVIDVTKRELLEKELRRARDLALAHERRTSEFLSSMSHELRTPMNGVIGMVTLLATTKLDEEQLEIVQLMRRSGDHLLCIINDILDLAKLEAGHVSLDPVAVDVETLLCETLASHEPMARQKNLTLGCELVGHVPYLCLLDPLRVRQVLTNLVGNAIKFTDHGGVKVACRRPSQSQLLVEVTDTGIGVAEEQLPLLFQAFSQADSGATRRYEGTGLGLTISKKLVERMGGQMGVVSHPGSGSTFWFTLPIHGAQSTLAEHYGHGPRRRVGVLFGRNTPREPVRSAFAILNWQTVELTETYSGEGLDAALVVSDDLDVDLLELLPRQWGLAADRIGLLSASRESRRRTARVRGLRLLSSPLALRELSAWLQPPEPLARRASATQTPPLAGAVVLVVEDNVVNQKVVKRLLEKAGANVILAGNGAQAIESVQRHPEIELVLMDCQMPEVDGFEATRRIRQSHPQLPVCALTADAIAGDKERCFDAGMNDYLTKPIQYDVLISTVKNWLGPSPRDPLALGQS